jgi:hypothetical protein
MQAAAGHVYKELHYKEYDHFRAMAQLFYASHRTVESYFWAARRLLGAPEHLTPTPRLYPCGGWPAAAGL